MGGMDPQKHSVGCLHGTSKFGDGHWFPLEFWLRDGRGRWHLTGEELIFKYYLIPTVPKTLGEK